jgi:Fe-Mn family superoxide dismutase
MIDMTRRGAVLAATVAAAGVLAAKAGAQDAGAAPPIKYDPKPLPFDPKSVHGLSEKLLVNHHDKNYAGAVTRLGQIQTRLAGLDLAKEPGFVLNGLKREELIALNSMILHEIYFAGFNEKKAPSDALAARLAKDWGSLDRWRTEFAAMGRALGGGSGWVLLTWSPRAGRLMNLWASDHTQTAADGKVLLALDMYEHAYQLDYGPDAGGYIDAFLGTMGWAHADEAFATL